MTTPVRSWRCAPTRKLLDSKTEDEKMRFSTTSASAGGKSLNVWIARLQHSMHQAEIKRFAAQALVVAIFLASAGLHVDNLNRVEVKQFPDTVSYTKKASWPLWGGDGRLGPFGALTNWWLVGRSPTVPFFYKLAGNTAHSIAVFQVCFSTLCWGLLARLVARAIQFAWLKPFAFLIVLMFSLSAHIIMWDGIILSDSISFSLMALAYPHAALAWHGDANDVGRHAL